MSTTEQIMIVFGTINATIFVVSASIAFAVYWWNDRQKKKDRALDLFKSLMTTEFLLKARLVAQEYLLEDPRNETYRKFKGLNFDELDVKLRSYGVEKERTERFYLRAIPNFFGSVDRLWQQGYLLQDEKVFARIYAWYWVNIIEERQVSSNPMYSFHEWMTTKEEVGKARAERVSRLTQFSKP